jgi:hypothetical protein
MIEPTEIRGRIVGGDPEAGEVIILNTDSSSEVPVTVTQNTAIYFRNGPGQISQLQRGAFVAARFDSAAGNKNIGKDIRIILVPGETFRFAGRVHNLDMRSGALTINNDSDDKFYELRASKNDLRNSNIRIGTEVDVSAQFDGRDYVVRTMRVTRAADTPAAKDDKK